MTLLKYLAKKFLPSFVGALGFFSLMLVLVDLFTNLWQFIQYAIPASSILRLMLLYVPKTLWYAAPLAVLFAVSFTLSSLYSNNELTVIFASGVSLFRFVFPLLLFSAFLSVGFFFFEDRIVVPYYRQKVEFQSELLGENSSKNNSDVVVFAENGRQIYKADYYDDNSRRLYGLIVILRNEERKLEGIVFADSAMWMEDHWEMSNYTYYRYEDGEATSYKNWMPDKMSIAELPETFRNFEISVEEVNTQDARAYISLLQRTGLPTGEAKSIYYKKYSFPTIIFLVVFLSVGLSGRSRKNVLLSSLILCVSAAVLFYVTQMVTMYLAKFNVISPFAGAWLPVFIFFGISIVLFRTSRT